MKRTNKVNLIGGTFTLAMTLAVASVGQKAWADDMTQVAPAAEIAPATNGADVLELQAIFMDVQGKVRWRKSEDSAWTEAKVNDLLSAGAEIRTGLKSRSTLRVGKNATILVDSGTTFKLPEIVQDGQTLRTLATVKSGRADFKVDHVGFANDFKVVTPQTTLSVRGTGFALASGPLKGVDVAGANTNTINAIEVKYIAANMSYFVSGQGQTSSESGKQDPVQNAWASTIGPPPIAGTYASQSDVEQQVAQGISGANPSSNTQQIQQTQASEANEEAVDTALVLASDTTGGGEESGSGYSLYQPEAQSTEQGLSLLNTDAQTNQGLSNGDLERFNNNFRVYETGQWTQSLLDLNTLWNGPGQGGGYPNQFTNSGVGVGTLLHNLNAQSKGDLALSNSNLNQMSFDANAYFFRWEDSEQPITETAFKDGALLNGATNSLWSLSESARTNLGIAVGLNSSVQTAFQSVQDSYGHLQVAQLALDGLSTGSAFSVEYTTTFTNQFANLNKFLSNLKNLIGASTSAQSQDAYAQLAGVVNSAAVHVELGLAAAKTARDNYNNASSRATQELFQAEELKYLDAVRIRLESIAYLTKERKNPDGSAAPDGPDGIKELAEQIMENFNVANNQFAWGSFSDYARPHVVDLSLLNAVAQTNQGLSNSNLERFNNNFRVYETGQWTQSLLNLNTLWNGPGQGGAYPNQFTNSGVGVGTLLHNLNAQSKGDLALSNSNLNQMSFDASRYFNNEDSSDAKDNFGDAVISTAAFTDGALLNGATNSLWSLSESARTNLGMAVGLNSSVQTAFQSVQDSYGHLQVAQLALDGLSTGSAFSVEYTTTFTNQFAKLNVFLSNLQNLIGASTSSQSQDAYAQLAGVVNSAAVHVELGLAAAKTARDNYNNASSLATQELFQAEELKYLDAVRIRLESIAYLTKERKNPDGSAAPDGPDGIKELAEQIMQNFNGANNQFAWGSFSDYARPQVVAAGIDSGAIVALARLSGDDSTAALEQLEDGSANRLEIDGQLYIMTQQVGLMQSKLGVADSQGNYAIGTLMGFHSQSVIDVESSNVFKGQFDQLFADGKFQSELDSDLNGLSDLNSLYTGDDSIQQKAQTTLEQISGHHDKVDNANSAIHGLTASYETHLANAISNAGASSTTFNESFTNSQATATKYLQDFTTIVGANTTKVATDALAAVATLVGEHNQYVKNASDAVGAARDAAVAAGTRGQQVYMGAVALRMGEAATIQSAANLAMLEVVTNGSAIQLNYSQAKADYDTRSPSGK